MDIIEQKKALEQEKLDTAMVKKTADRLALVPDDGELEDELDDELEGDSLNEDDEVKDETGDEDVVEGTDETETDKTGTDETENETVLPENYRRAALHQDWSAEEISDFFTKNPEQALKTFKKIYESTNYISEQTAALGRLSQQKQKEKLEETNKPVKPKFKEAIKSLKDKYGEEDPALVDMLDVLADQNEQMYEAITSIKAGQAQPKFSEEEMRIGNTINGFFNDKDIAVYESLYGKSENVKNWGMELTGTQYQNRMKILEYADQMVAGAELQGKKLDYDTALLRAHFIISDKEKTGIVRKDLINKVKERNNGLTVKGTGKAKVGKPKGEKTTEGAVKKAKGRLGKLFGIGE